MAKPTMADRSSSQRILVTPQSVAGAREDEVAARRLEGALTSSENALSLEALHAWVSSASDAIVVLRPDGDILYANDQASAVFARIPAALIGQSLAEVVTPGSRVSVERALEMARKNGDATLQFETDLADAVFAEDRPALGFGQRLRHL
jgi:PAS domain-containing protein